MIDWRRSVCAVLMVVVIDVHCIFVDGRGIVRAVLLVSSRGLYYRLLVRN